MLDPKLLRNDLEVVVAQLARKGVHFDATSYQALETSGSPCSLKQNRCKTSARTVRNLLVF